MTRSTIPSSITRAAANSKRPRLAPAWRSPKTGSSSREWERPPAIRNDGKPDIVILWPWITKPFPCSAIRGTGSLPISPRRAISITTAERMCLSRGQLESPGYAAQAPLEQPNTIFRNAGNAKFGALTAEAGFRREASFAPSRLGHRRPQWRASM
jgi:hypothetical protein